MMQAFRTENNYRNASRLSAAELRAAMTSREILQSTALAFDTQRQLRFELGGCRAVMPFGQCADGADTGSVRDIAVLTRVGRPTCFVIEGIDTDESGQPFYRLSRAEAQRMCKAEYLDQLLPGDILPCVVTHIEPFGAFCDVGCGAAALLGTQELCISRLRHAGELLTPGQRIYAAIRTLDRVQRRVFLTQRELLGTWAENAARFCAGQTVTGVVRSLTDYGAFIELTPNLSGLAEDDGTLRVGDHVAVYIRAIVPETLKIKLSVLHRVEPQPREPLHYFQTGGHITQWRYGNEHFAKCYTIF